MLFKDRLCMLVPKFAPKTIPPEINTQFFMMYWPSKVGTSMEPENVSWGNNNNGKNVPAI